MKSSEESESVGIPSATCFFHLVEDFFDELWEKDTLNARKMINSVINILLLLIVMLFDDCINIIYSR
jgi:hypothetical protein